MSAPISLRKRVTVFICLSAVIYGSLTNPFPMRRVIRHISYFEKIDIIGSYSIRVLDDPSGWILVLKMKNWGGIVGTMTNLYIDDHPLPDSNYGGSSIVVGEVHTSIPDAENGLPIEKDEQTGTFYVYVSDMNVTDGSWVIYHLRIHSENGMDYFQNFTLYKSRIYPIPCI